MAFTRRHYEKIAMILHDSNNKEEIKERLESMFSEDNPRFDRDKFDIAVRTGYISRKKLHKII